MGIGPFGAGTPATASDPPTGAIGCRFIDPRTRDYAQDVITKQQQQMPAVRQRVLLTLMTVRNSSTLRPAWGLRGGGRIDPSFATRRAAEIRFALRQMVEVEKVLEIRGIDVRYLGSGRTLETVDFVDLTTGLPDRVP